MARSGYTAKLITSVKQNRVRYMAITPQFEAFPYAGGVTITYQMWRNAALFLEEVHDQEETLGKLDELTEGGFSRLIGIFGDGQPDKFFGCRTVADFNNVMRALQRGMVNVLGETVPADMFGCPDIGPYLELKEEYGDFEKGGPSGDSTQGVKWVNPWHSKGPVSEAFYADAEPRYRYTTAEGEKYAIKPYNNLTSWDMYECLVNLCAAGYEKPIQRLLDAKVNAEDAAKLEVKAAEINYDKITGVQTGYTAACNAMDDLIARAVVGKDKETHVQYEPPRGEWGPTMDAYLPKEHLRKWQATDGSNPIQLKRLRGVIFSMLVHAEPALWWKTQRQVTLTLGQIERAYWRDKDHKATQAERDLMVSSLSLLVNTRFESKYPPKSRAKKYEHIDMESLIHEGITLLPAQFVRGVDANGHVIDAENAALQFYALPPLDMDADELDQAYNVPYLDGSKDGLVALPRVESTTYDVEHELVKYIRIAVENGKVTGYVKEIARITNANEYNELKHFIDTVLAAAKYRGASHEEIEEVIRQRKKAQRRLANIRARVKKDIKRVMPVLVSNERLKKRYLNVTATKNGQAFEIRRVKARRDPKTKKFIEPPFVCEL